ncbi:TPA: HU family DNA-binding protein [Vibrio parahaemolyticus]|nr:HU family DNA-binding protein [Vibrio parahaemolyticus]
MAVITRKMIANEIYDRGIGLHRNQIDAVLKAMVDAILDITLRPPYQAQVQINNFGVFSVKEIAPKEGNVPNKKTSKIQRYTSPPRARLRFSYNDHFRKAVIEIKNGCSPRFKVVPQPFSAQIQQKLSIEGIDEDCISGTLNVFICLLAKHLANEDELVLRRLGRFTSDCRYDQKVRNPRVNEIIIKDLIVRLRFRAGKKAAITND